MSKTMDRRTFLRLTGLSAAAAGAAALSRSTPARALSLSKGGTEPMGMMIDLTLCDGCAGAGTPACVTACRSERRGDFPQVKGEVPVNYPTGKNEDWRGKADSTTTLTPYNWTFVQKAKVEQGGGTVEVNIPRHCMHCDDPPCASLCPFGVIEKKGSGAVCIDSEHCFGGAKCRSVCPWGIPQRQGGVGLYMEILPGYAGGGAMFKCDLCAGRLEKGMAPACVDACRARKGAAAPLWFGTRREARERAAARAREIGGHLYGATENGGTGVVYVSAVPFPALDAALRKDEKERFPLPADPDPMGSPRVAAAAAAVAPVAGVAAAVIAARKAVRGAMGEGDVAALEEKDEKSDAGEMNPPEVK